jgi:hypothetical protein
MSEPPEPLALKGGQRLERFLRRVPETPLAERFLLVEQALRLLDGFYVHLSLKRAMHASDPIQRLRLLRQRLADPSMGSAAFHGELLSIFVSLRDLHTQYQLPPPYAGHVAALGFLVERYYPHPRARPRYVVSNLHPTLVRGSFESGVELVSWNGVPIERAVERNAERASGSNYEARLARGLERLTLRPLRSVLPPDEYFVLLAYRTAGGATAEARLAWKVLAPEAPPAGGRERGAEAVGLALEEHGIDAGAEASRRAKTSLFARSARAARDPAAAIMRHQTLSREIGYLRLFSFNVTGLRGFLDAVEARIAALPEQALIVDIRGNPGGLIPAAETLLQLLTPRAVKPVEFSMATTPQILALCRENPALQLWMKSVHDSVETGEVFSQAFPLTDPEKLAEGRPRYGGSVVLVTDALCYSAADIFAAGFQDNEIGRILGTDGHTGAGGANVWTHDLLRFWLPDALAQLPAGASFRIALRRATRNGAKTQGTPLEDYGVTPDRIHRLTLRDLISDNEDLKAAATRLVA